MMVEEREEVSRKLSERKVVDGLESNALAIDSQASLKDVRLLGRRVYKATEGTNHKSKEWTATILDSEMAASTEPDDGSKHEGWGLNERG